MPSTSERGRPQFSVENAKSVTIGTPCSAKRSIEARIVSAPARWPSWRDSPRARAQRPLPSMMIATWRGNGWTWGSGLAACAGCTTIGWPRCGARRQTSRSSRSFDLLSSSMRAVCD